MPVKSLIRPRNPQSKWRIIAPFTGLPLLAPSLVLAYACATDQGPWAADGYFGSPAGIGTTLGFLSPLLVWAACWLWKWEGDHDILEPRVIVAFLAVLAAFLICAGAEVSLQTSAALEGLAGQ